MVDMKTAQLITVLGIRAQDLELPTEAYCQFNGDMLVYFAEQFAWKRISEKGVQDQLQRAKIPTHVAGPMHACPRKWGRAFRTASAASTKPPPGSKRMDPEVFSIGKAKAGRHEKAVTHDSLGSSAHDSLPPDMEP
eukprot:3781785-Amphidinium_carterae.1